MISGNLCISISDHLPSFLLVPHSNNYNNPKQTAYRRDSKRFDRENFILDYLAINWDDILQLDENDVNLSLSLLLSKIDELLDKYMPWKKVTSKDLKKKSKPWITNDIFNKLKLKSKIYGKYIKCKSSQVDLKNTLLANYKSLKNEITLLMHTSKKDNRYFTNNRKSLCKTWEGIKEIINLNPIWAGLLRAL